MNSEGQDFPFRLLLSDVIKGRIRYLLRRAEVYGVQGALRHSLTEIDRGLRNDPRAWGDPFLNLPTLRSVVYRRIFDQLKVTYTVHDNFPYVWLNGIIPVLRHPLLGNEMGDNGL